MADAGTAVFKAVGKFGPLTRPAREAEDALRGTEDAAKGVGKGLPKDGGGTARGLQSIGKRAGEIGEKMQGTGTKLSIGLTAPLVLFGRQAIRTFADFESSLKQAQNKAGASEEQYQRMKDLALDLGASTQFSARESADAMDRLAAAGMDAEQTMKALPGVMNAAGASGEDLALTGDIVAKTINAFGLEAEDATKVADVFASAANTTALGMQELSEGMAHAGQLGSRYGQDLTGVTAALGRLVDQGVPAASAGTALRSMFDRLAVPTSKQAKLMDKLGVSVRNGKGEFLQLPEIFANMEEGLSDDNKAFRENAKIMGMSTTEYRDHAIKALLPTVEAQKALSLVMSDGKATVIDTRKETGKMAALQEGLAEVMGEKQAKAWIAARTEMGEFEAKGADAVTAVDAIQRASEGLSEEINDDLADTSARKLEEFGGAWETLQIRLIEDVLPAITDVVEKLTEGIDKVAQFIDKNPGSGKLIGGLLAVLAVLGPALILIGGMARGIGAIARGAGKVVGAVSGRNRRSKRTRSAPGAGGGSGGSDKGGMRVWWARPMPVHIVAGGGKGAAGGKGGVVAGGGGKSGGTSATKKSTVPFVGWGLGDAKKAKKQARQERKQRRRAAISRGARGTGRAVGGAGATASGAAGMTLATGGSMADAAKMAAIFAGIELAMVAVRAAMTSTVAKVVAGWIRMAVVATAKAGVMAVAWLIGIIRAAARAVAAMIRAAAVVIARWIAMAAVAIAQAARLALAWTIGVVAGAARSIAAMTVAAAFIIARWVMMGTQALIQAARMAAAWLIAMGPVGLVIAIIIGLALLIWKNWDKIKEWTKAAWEWVWDKIKWLADKAWSLFKNWSLPGLIIKHWDKIKTAVKKAVDWVLDKIQPLIDAFETVADFGGGLKDKATSVGKAIIPGWSTGGLIGGTGRGDKQPSMLEAGEYVVRRAVVRQPGVLAGLRQLNAGGGPGSFDLAGQQEPLHTRASSGRRSGAAVASAAYARRVEADRIAARVDAMRSPGSPPADLARRGDDGGMTVRELAVTVNNPKPERAGRSVSKVLRSTAEEEGWT